jgi:hypothetical protein
MGALYSLFAELPNLNEIGADGFKAEGRDSVRALWGAISQLPTLVACDLPQRDAKNLNIPLTAFGPEFVESYMVIKAKPRLTTLEQRIDYTLRVIRENQVPDTSAELFQNAAAVVSESRKPDAGDTGTAAKTEIE